jgi:V-type H+-transporting ATPase subunit E
MKTKNSLVENIIDETLTRLTDFCKSDNQRYRELVKNLIVEGMIKLLEPECIVKVKKEDAEFVKGILKECEVESAQKMKKETERDYNCSLVVDDGAFLENVW